VDVSVDDLTARARIRDAALRMFAERGIDGATVRDIARAAGVSAGLLRHHFGSKDALRDACDTYALDQIMRFKEQAIPGGQLANPAFLPAAHPTLLLLMRYLIRSMVDGSAAAAGLYDQMVDLAEDWFAKYNPGEFRDPRASAAVLVAMQTGLLMLHDHVSRALGADVLSGSGHVRMGRALVDFYSHPLLSAEIAEQAHAAYDRLEQQQGEQ
jgi:TetR/AcrR family transcriptional regulator, regulator of cefoperazone and chloramphenicol sensitivity